MIRKSLIAISAVLFILFSACETKTRNAMSDSGDTLRLEYAELLTIVKHNDFTEVKITNPWRKGSLLHTYILVDADQSLPAHLPKGTIVRTPIEKCIVFTTAHASLIGMLNATDQIGGVADLKYMLLPDIHKRVENHLIADCGDAMSPNIEKIVELEADAILLSPFDNSGGYGRLEEIGIPIIECADYMETSALGRAEWMKFYGMLYGKLSEAERLFEEVSAEYLKLKQAAKQSSTRLSLLPERLTGSTWYIAGGQSSVGQIIADANGEYAFADDTHSGSIALPFETVLDRFGNADVWVFNHFADSPISYAQLSSEHHGYASFKAFKLHQVFYVNSSQVPYFEEVSFRPDYLLREYIILLHPDMKAQLGALRYYKPVVD